MRCSELENGLRALVLMRFFEDLTLRAIAERLRMPLPTVQTRLERALAELRARLDRHYGDDRRAWCVALGSLTGLPSATGAMAMATALCATLLVVAAGTWLVWPDAAQTSVPSPSAARSTVQASLGASESVARSTVAQVQPAIARSTRGSLSVHVRHTDGAPAANIGVSIVRADVPNVLADSRSILTGDDGSFTIDDLEAGPWVVRLDRGTSARAEVHAGERAAVELELQIP